MTASTHYKTSFDFARDNGIAGWADLLKMVRTWVAKKVVPDDEFGRRWFFTAGHWEDNLRRSVHTDSVRGRGDETTPEHWALRLDEPCRDVKLRRWCTDIGVTALDPSRFRVTIATTHRMLPGYIGPEPTEPIPTAPGVVGQLLRANGWQAFCGSTRLTAIPKMLSPGDGVAFRQLLADPDRGCPIVLVSIEAATGRALVDSDRLAKWLTGAALVVLAKSPDVDEELDWVLENAKTFRCQNGTVRVYQPVVQFDNERDGVRHRFFTSNDIARCGPEAVEKMLVVGVARRGWHYPAGGVATIDDLASRRRELRLGELRASRNAVDQSDQQRLMRSEEETRLFEEENRQLEERLKVIRDERDGLMAERERQQDELAGLDRKLAAVEFDKFRLLQSVAEHEALTRSLKEQTAALGGLTKLPETLAEVVELIGGIHAGRVVFTDKAKRSAEKAAFSDPFEGWRCLWAVATVLYDLYFSDTPVSDIGHQFKSRSGFELSLTEGSQTNKDKKMVGLRQDVWEGIALDLSPHVKAGRSPRMLRVHYHAHRTKEGGRIVVGHCGDHLDTSGTRRRG